MTHEYKVGDKVRKVSDSHGLKVGEVYEITEIDPEDETLHPMEDV